MEVFLSYMSFKTKSIISSILLISLLGGTLYALSHQKEKPSNSKSSQTSSETHTKIRETTIQTESSERRVLSVEEQLKQMLKEMSIDEKVGQLFLVRVPESNALEDIKKFQLGGYLLFGRDTENETKETLTKKIAEFQQTSQTPFMVASDEEGGTVTRVSSNNKIVSNKFESPQSLYKKGGMSLVLEDTKYKSDIFKELGIHTGLYPVADVSMDPESFIYDRTIGLDVDGTSQYVVDVVKELKKNKIGSTLKHFPGYGDNRDSHTEIVRDTRSLEEIEKTSLPPFKKGIEAGADSILISHNIVDAIDSEVPASISAKIHEVLRQELEFDGVIMTDDMDMAGLADFISQEQAALAALKSGNDLILSSTYNAQIPVVKEAVESGDYPLEQLDTSVLRVLKWKYELGIIQLEE